MRENVKIVFIVAATLLLNFANGYQNVNEDVERIDEINIESRDENDYRLPKTLSPENYEIHLTPHITEGNFTFDGTATIFLKVIEQTNSINLHAKDLRISSIEANSSDSGILNVENRTLNEITDILTINLVETLAANSTVNIKINYVGLLNDDMTGFYRSSYVNSNGDVKWIATTQFQPTYARQAFPCFDEPSFKAKFLIVINRPNNLHAISNMPIASSSNYSNELVTDVFAETPIMSTYLVAFIVSDFASVSNANGNFSVWSRPNAIEQSIYAFEIGPSILEYFTRVTGHDYPLPKLDMAALSDFDWGAMENWGLITYRETAMLYDENHSSNTAKARVATVVAHEIAHMWFGNIVTLKWWDYAWLNEGFARRFQYLATDSIETTWNLRHQFLVEQHHVVFANDALESSHALVSSVLTPSQISNHFSTISYNKGASLIRMIENIIGESVWYAALHDYIDANLYGNVEPDDLWSAVQNQLDLNTISLANQTAKTIFDTWILQAGYPIVNVTIDRSTGVVELNQERFLLRKTGDSLTNLTWWVPITFATKNNSDFDDTSVKYWLSNSSASLEIDVGIDDWVVFNVQETGYYRVNYDTESWQMIIDLLDSEEFETIHVLNRAQIIDDLINLARVDHVSYKMLLTATKYLSRERNYIPWKAFFNGFDYLSRRLIGRDNVYNLFKTYVLDLIDNVYNELGFDDKTGEDWLDTLNRRLILDWACKFGHEDCVSKSREYFANFKANASLPVSPNQRTAVYCTAIKYGNTDDWQFLWEQYVQANVAAEKVVILQALGCSQNHTILYNYLHYLLEEERGIRPQDMSTVYAAVYTYGGLVGVEATLDFVDDYYSDVANYYGSLSYVSSILNGASQRLSTQELFDKYSNILTNHASDFSSISGSLSSQLTLASYELNWYTEHSDEIFNWLNSIYSGTKAYRLPTNIIPETYDIRVTPYLVLDNFTFDGEVDILAKVVEATNTIVIHVDEIEYKVITIKSNDVVVDISDVDYDSTYHFLTIKLNSMLYAGSKLDIHIEYWGYLNTAMRGFYRSSYINDNNERRWLASTHLEPVGARKMFPCFDEPALKAKFIIRVNRPQDYHVISNMPLNYSSEVTDGRVWDTFRQSVTMSTYLVAVIVSDFGSLVNDTAKFGVWARPDAIEQASYALSIGPPLVTYFENLLNLDYQLPELHMAALPDFTSGAMENWGLLTYRETRMLVDNDHTSAPDKQVIANVISHEITHQWFGDLVSPQWWKYLWLNEGFARYYQYHATRTVEPTWGLDSQFVVEQLQTVMVTDSLTSTHPMSYDVWSPTAVRGIFDSISYAKAASVIRMMEKTFGSTLFHDSLHDYLKAREYDYATPEHLWEAFQAQIDASNFELEESVETVMKTWTDQAGLPVVNVTIKNGVASLSQEKFILRNTIDASTEQTWWIPITWTTKSNPQFANTTPIYWLSNRTAEIAVNSESSEWVIFNLQESGYYRVNYDVESWRRIINALKTEEFTTIHELNRAAVIVDLFNLARAGYVNYEILLDATQYLVNETNYIPWRAAFNELVYLNRRFADTPAYDLYKQHIRTLIDPIYETLGFNEVQGEDYFDTLLRRYVLSWACDFDKEDCVAKSKELFATWRQNTSAIVPVNLRTTVYCTAIKYGSSEDWEFLWQKYKESNVATEDIVILNALGCSENQTILHNYLTYAITEFGESGIRSQDSTTVFSSVYSAGRTGAEYVIDFVDDHHKEMSDYYGGYSSVASIISGVAARLSSEDSLGKLETFIKNNEANLTTIISSLNSYLNLAKYELNWYEKNSPIIIDWLIETYGTTNPDYRLPTNIMPDSYEIYLTPYLEPGNFIFNGDVYIYTTVVEETSKIVLHAHELTIHKIDVVVNNLDTVSIARQNYNSTTQKLTLSFDEKFSSGTSLRIYFDFTGIINDEMAGFYRSSYRAADGTTHWIASTQFQPTHARRAFPCFDEPSFKAKFTINIEAPDGYRSISNMPLSNAMDSDDEERMWHSFEETVKMSSYLVAFVIVDYESIGNDSENFKIWARPNAVEYADYALNIGPKILDFLAEYTNIAYPLPKMDMVAIPDFSAGAMENWGLVTYREYGLLSHENVTSATYRRYINTIISHELVHMWFGNLVTCEWWDFTWLNEGFAQYYQYVAGNAVEPTWNLLQQFVIYGLQNAMEIDASSSIRPMNNNVSTPSQISGGFDTIAYAKSASVIRMMEHSFGATNFKTALHNYLDTNKYDTSNPDKLWKAIQDQIDETNSLGSFNKTVKTLMDSWTTQSGYPVVNATLTNGYLSLTQERFLLKRTESSATNYSFWIPITYTTQSSPDFESTTPKLWIGENSDSNSLINLGIDNDQWFILNIQQVGYYRVNYDQESWYRIISALKSANFQIIHEINRAQIIDDLFNLARSGYVDYAVALDASLYLKQESNHLPWKAFFNGIAYLNARFEGQENIKELLDEYVVDIIDNIYDNIGFDDVENEGQLNELNRQLMISSACNFGHNGCIEKAKSLFADWKNDDSKWIAPNIRPAVYCTALKHGDYDDWEFLWEQYETTNFATEQMVILAALGCTTNSTTLRRYLDRAISLDEVRSIRKQDVSNVFSSVYGAGQFGLEQTIEYLISNYNDMYEYYQSWSNVASIFSSVASRISTDDQISMIENFIADNPDLIAQNLTALNSYVTTAKTNIEWYRANNDTISTWFRYQNGDIPTTTTTTTTTTTMKTTTGNDEDVATTTEGENGGAVALSINILMMTTLILMTLTIKQN